MEINRREHHYMGIFEEVVQLAIEDSTSQVDWEDVFDTKLGSGGARQNLG
jgi:hypothetical protein